MHSLQEARTLGPLCGRSLILAISKIYAETSHSQTTNLGVRSSNLFGRAIQSVEMSQFLRHPQISPD
jgi:hypothetical protein